MIAPQVNIYIDKAQSEAFLTALQPVWKVVTSEPKCLFFDIFRITDPADPGVEIFRIVEVWNADEEWFRNVQGNKDYYKEYFEIMQKLSMKPKEFSIWQRMDGWTCVRPSWIEMTTIVQQ